MYLRTTRRRNGNGSDVRYLSLAHNEWDPVARRSKVRILFNFGREDELDPGAIRRLIGSLSRALPPDEALALAAPELVLESRPLGGAHLLDGLWHRLGLHEILARLLRGRRLDPSAERALFALVANRALAPASKLSCAAWVSERAAIPGLAELSDDQCYRAMDWLLAIEAELAEQVYWPSPISSTSKSTCSSSTPRARTSRPTRPTRRALGRTRASAPSATARTTGRTCPRS